jgi:hypothetical protein
MSTTKPAPRRDTRSSPGGHQAQGEGWILFSGIVLAMLATLNLIDGIAAVSKSTFFVGHAQFVVSDLKSWGWFLIVVAVVQGVTSIGVCLRWHGWRWVGVSIAGINSVMQLLFLPAYPLWAICLFALDILVMYGLVMYGGTQED